MWKSSARVVLSDLRENIGFMGHTASDEALQHTTVTAYVQPAIGDVMSFSDSYRYIHSFCLSYLLFVCLKKRLERWRASSWRSVRLHDRYITASASHDFCLFVCERLSMSASLPLALFSQEEGRAHVPRGSGPADSSQIMGIINGLEMGSAFSHFSPANPEAPVSDPEARLVVYLIWGPSVGSEEMMCSADIGGCDLRCGFIKRHNVFPDIQLFKSAILWLDHFLLFTVIIAV